MEQSRRRHATGPCLPAVLAAACLSILPVALSAQDIVRITQRQDLRRQLDGKPTGLVHAYTQGQWTLGSVATDGSRPVTAWYWTTGGTVNDLSREAKELNGEFRASFRLGPDGSVTQSDNSPAPFYRNFPVAPPKEAGPGAVWEAPAVLVADPAGSGRWTRLNLMVQYRWAGSAEWRGKPVLDVRAKFAVRYRPGGDPAGDPDLRQAEGTRDATIYLDPDTRFPVFIREQVGHELWQFASGKKIQYDGFILTFFEGSSFPTGLSRLVQGPQTSPGPLVADAGGGKPSASPTAQPGASPAPASSGSPEATALPGGTTPSTSPVGSPGALPATTLAAGPPASSSPPPSPNATPGSSPGPAQSPGPLVATAGGGSPSLARTEFHLDPELERLNQELMTGGVPDVSLKTEERGINLTIENLQFQADTARLLPGEANRLASIAALLAKVPAGRSFLVLGHTALAGSVAGQKALSLERAKSIVEALKQRGIPAERFLYDGRGATQPIAPNDTEAGRAKNRRVEIIILD